MKKMILMAVGALLLVGISVGASLFFTGALSKEEPVDPAAALPAEPVPKIGDVFYYNIQPEFVVNFQGKSRVKFLMIEMVVESADEQVPIVLDDHDPELRDTLLMLLAEQDSEVLKTVEGKQALRDAAMERVDGVVERHYMAGKVDNVFITRLVMQ